MTEGVIDQATAPPETAEPPKMASDKARENFARLEAAKQVERDARIRAEMEREMLQKQIDEMKQHQATKDEVDPLDGVEDYVDKERLQQIRKKDKAAFQKEAEEIANRTYEARRKDEDRRNFLPKLKSQFGDYDQVMTEQNIAELEQSSPAFVNSVLKISDDYERRLLTYEYLKAKKANKVVEDKPSIKQRVEENQQNPYFVPAGSGTPSALEFDVKSKTARDQAYSKLKEAQRRPIGNGAPQR